MSTLTPDRAPGRAPGPSGPSGPPGGGARTPWHRHRASVLIGAMLVVAVAAVALTSGGPVRSATYDPDNPGPDGAQAVARVLDDEGVAVDVVRSADALADAAVASGDTVVVTSSSNLGPSTVERLLADSVAARIVVVDPSSALLGLLGIDGFTSALDTGGGAPVPAGCADPTYDGLEVAVDGGSALPTEDATDDAGAACFGGALVRRDRIELLGAGQLLTNDQVLRADNAAVALRLLGSGDRLVWYVADAQDLVADDSVSISSLLPDWIGPGLFALCLAAIALVLWRGRRLGPLAVEPLPVVVKAIETTVSRGRLYRRSGDRAHTAQALRRAARDRARARLRLGTATDERTLVTDVARLLDRPVDEVAALLASTAPPPGSDRELIRLAGSLAALDREVRRT